MSDDVGGIGPEETPEEATPVVTTPRRPARDPRAGRKIVALILLILLLLLLGYAAYYYSQNRRLPVPRVGGAEDRATLAPVYLYSITGEGETALRRPIGVAVSPDGRVYVSDLEARAIRVYTREGRHLFTFNAIDDGANTELRNPVHLALDANGDLWVTDRRLQAVYVFDRDGNYLRKFLPDNDAEFKWTPLALTVDATGNVYVTDVGNTKKHQVLYFDPQGAKTAQFGETVQVDRLRRSPGGFYFPNGLAAYGGLVLISDGDNRRVQVYDSAGEYRYIIETQGVPRGIAVDGQGRVFVVDALSHQVDIYDIEGKPIVQFGSRGFGPGQFAYPNDIALDRDRIYVTDRENDQVQVWGWPRAELPPIPEAAARNAWKACIPLIPLLLLPFLLRKRRFVVTPDFAFGMVEAGKVTEMDRRRFRWIVPEADHPRYEGRTEEGVDLGELMHPETYSASDVEELMGRLGIEREPAIVLAMSQRHKRLCTEDVELARLAAALRIETYDRQQWLERYARGEEPPSGPAQSA